MGSYCASPATGSLAHWLTGSLALYLGLVWAQVAANCPHLVASCVEYVNGCVVGFPGSGWPEYLQWLLHTAHWLLQAERTHCQVQQWENQVFEPTMLVVCIRHVCYGCTSWVVTLVVHGLVCFLFQCVLLEVSHTTHLDSIPCMWLFMAVTGGAYPSLVQGLH